MNIPKKIHYCWFGPKPIPETFKQYLESWKKFCPDYEIIFWNEKNFDLNSTAWTKVASEHGKWAAAVDYIRFKIIYEHGGIYLDTDVELIKNFDSLLQYEAFIGFEQNSIKKTYFDYKALAPNYKRTLHVASGLGFGAIQKHPVIKKMVEHYEKDRNFDFDVICPTRETNELKKIGLNTHEDKLQTLEYKNKKIAILSTDYLCPIPSPGKLNLPINFDPYSNFTQNSISIHHYDGSWLEDKVERDKNWISKLLRAKKKYILCKKIQSIFGINFGYKLFKLIRIFSK